MDNSTQGRLQDRKPVAVIDIGSNSIRLVVYEGLSRSPTPAFPGKGDVRARPLPQFHPAPERGDDPLCARVASPVREARRYLRRQGTRPSPICDGSRPLGGGWSGVPGACARKLAAFRSRSSAMPKRPSSPLPASRRGFCILQASWAIWAAAAWSWSGFAAIRCEETVSLPLGGLALLDKTKGEKAKAIPIIAEALAPLSWLSEAREEPFYAVGGTWRTLAKLYMRANRLSADGRARLCPRRPQSPAGFGALCKQLTRSAEAHGEA